MENVETWKELVKCRRGQSSGNVPRNFLFLDHRYLLFLGIDASIERENPTSLLYYVDLYSDEASSSIVSNLNWKPLSDKLLGSVDQFSRENSKENNSNEALKEEELLRERQRRLFEGLCSYQFHPLTQRLLLPQSTKLNVFVYNNSNSSASLEDSFQFFGSYQTSEGYLDPKWSPDGRFISFIRNGDIWLLSLRDNSETRLTFSEKDISCGVAEYIMQEEFDRFTGYWWSPALINWNKDLSGYCILYLEVDQSSVPLHRGICWRTRMEAEEIRYPRVGDANAVVEPRILFLPSSENNLLSLSGEEDVRKDSLKSWRPQRSIYQQFPWVEYIVRGGWLADDPFQSQHNLCSSSSWKNVYFWLALLDRSQQHLAIVVFDITSDSGEGVIVWEERQPQWINVPDFVLFLDENNSELSVPIDQFTSAMKYDNSIEFDYYLKSRACITCPQQHIDSKHMANIPKNITFLIVSEVDGYAHLYYSQLRLERQDTCLECHLFYQPLTNVANKDEDPHSLLLVTTVKHIDYCKGHIYFIGICKSGLEKHLYVWKQSGVILRLTDGGTNCMECCVREDANRLLIQWTSLVQFPETYIMDKKETLHSLEWIPKWRIQHPPLHPHFEFSVRRNPPLLFYFQVEENVNLYGCLYLPPQLQVDRTSCTEPFDIHSLSHHIQNTNGNRYPLLLIVYGGPHIQLVSNDYRLTAQLKYQYLASQGIICMLLDNRGSSNRGHDFETCIYGKLGQIEVHDQIAALQSILGQGFVDTNRTAVFGWSYGGYMSLMLFAKYSNLFRIAIAGAPVVNWEDYDSGYTERYMGLLSENPQGYSQSSVRSWIDQLPNEEEGRLVLVHSLSDENVHPQHIFQLIDALVQQGKSYTLYLFPRERHGLRELTSQVYFEHLFGRILYQKLVK